MNVTPTRLALAFALALLQGCAAGGAQYAESGESPPPLAPSAATAGAGERAPGAPATAGAIPDVTGVWQGQSSAECAMLIPDETRCGAVNSITFTLLQKSATVDGYYKCGYGNMDCRNGNDTGRVARGEMGATLLKMRVMMPDGSDCMFNGKPKGDAVEGGYLCLQGGGMIERGIWKARRSY